MNTWNLYIAGAEDLWCWLVISVFLFVALTVRLIRSWRLTRVAWLGNDEAGATYMLPLLLTLPFYVLLITMIIECTLMLTAKIGSVGAAYAAARAAAVWLPYETAMPKNAPDYTPLESRQTMVRLAAARAMFPYASGSTAHASTAPLDDFVAATAQQQIAAFQAYSGAQQFSAEYLQRKFAYAYNGSTVLVEYLEPDTGEAYDEKETPAFNAKIRLTLRYEAPIHTYGIGRLFGERSQFGRHFVKPVITVVVIENEGVKTSLAELKVAKNKRSKSLGIRYYTAAAFSASASSRHPLTNHSNDTTQEPTNALQSQTQTAARSPTPALLPADLDSIDARRDAYATHQQELEEAGQLASQVKFPTAARKVSEELKGWGQWLFYFNATIREHLNKINARVYEFNYRIFEALKSQPNQLLNPIAALPSELVKPGDDSKIPLNGFEFDLQMVIAEQRIVSSEVAALGERAPYLIVELNKTFDTFLLEDVLHAGIYGTVGNSWAEAALGREIDFSNEQDRIAIGHAMIFAEHGYTREQYLDFKLKDVLPSPTKSILEHP